LDIEVQTDEWFIDAVSKDLNLATATITRKSVAAAVANEGVLYKKIPELKGKTVNIALLPVRIQSQVENILLHHMEVE
jgi:hypothetical protein